MDSAAAALLKEYRILVIDDSPNDRVLMIKTLHDAGFADVQEAENGNRGLLKVEMAAKIRKPFHLIVTDWRMPEKDGLTLLKIIRTEKLAEKTMIFMVTSESDREQVIEAFHHGAHDYLLKPIEPTIFTHKVKKLLKITVPKT
ncbi:MAG: response regulator [Bdellovibrionota bacterium]